MVRPCQEGRTATHQPGTFWVGWGRREGCSASAKMRQQRPGAHDEVVSTSTDEARRRAVDAANMATEGTTRRTFASATRRRTNNRITPTEKTYRGGRTTPAPPPH